MKLRQVLKQIGVGGLIVAGCLGATGCSLLGQEQKQEIDPPQVEVQPTMTPIGSIEAALLDEAGRTTIYAQDRHGYVAPVTLFAAQPADQLPQQLALEMMVEGGPYASLLPEGFRGVLPAGTQVLDVALDPEQQLATINFSQHFLDYYVQDERKMLEALVWTLTGDPSIRQVALQCEGEPLAEMPVDGFPLDQPLSRAMGINLEQAPGVELGRSMPVTLYFTAATSELADYYVPVTRLIARSDDRAAAAMAQLIAGPLPDSQLAAVMTDDLTVESLEIAENLAALNLLDDSFQEGQRLPSTMLESIILCLTENSDAQQVQIQLNGSGSFTDTDNRSYAEAVARPQVLNAWKL